jgi:hypothetical protein
MRDLRDREPEFQALENEKPRAMAEFSFAKQRVAIRHPQAEAPPTQRWKSPFPG